MPNERAYNLRNSASDEPPKSPTAVHSIVNDLVQALQNQDVTEALAKALDPFIKLAVEETVKSSLTELNNAMDKIKQENKIIQEKTNILKAENDSLKKRLSDIEDYLDVVERNEKSYNVIIRGLPETSYAERATQGADEADIAQAEPQSSVEKSVLDLLQNKLNIPAVSDNIVSAFRLKSGKNDKTRPVLVKFESRKLRDKVLSAKRVLGRKRDNEQDEAAGTNPEDTAASRIYISEQLTKKISDLFFRARELKRKNHIHAAWTRNGKLYVKTSGELTCKPKQINSLDDLPRH